MGQKYISYDTKKVQDLGSGNGLNCKMRKYVIFKVTLELDLKLNFTGTLKE